MRAVHCRSIRSTTRTWGDRLAREQVLAPAVAVDVLEQVASALGAAHTAGMKHRDVNPSNVLLIRSQTSEGRTFAYLVDFGIAQAVDGTQGLTETGGFIGTLAYMAPERFGTAASDRRADAYSLAAVLCEALTGRAAFDVSSAPTAMYAHMHTSPRGLLSYVPACRPGSTMWSRPGWPSTSSSGRRPLVRCRGLLI
jgi:serine/threonine protein kinase